MDHARRKYESCVSKETELIGEVPGESEISKKSSIVYEGLFFNRKKCIYAKIEKSNMLFWTFLFPLPSAIPLGILVVRGDCDLETCRMYIDRLQEVSFFSQSFMLLSFLCLSITSHLYLLLK